jgi:glutathione S-transferase
VARRRPPWHGPRVLTLYDYAHSGNGWKVRTLFRHLGRPFVIRWVDLLRGEQNEPWFRAKNVVGDGCTVADFGLYAYLHVAHEAGFDMGHYPAVVAWLERVADVRGVSPMNDNPEALAP